MSNPKGPAIPEDTFDVKGHACSVRYKKIEGEEELGFDFELTPEARESLKAQGIEIADAGETHNKSKA